MRILAERELRILHWCDRVITGSTYIFTSHIGGGESISFFNHKLINIDIRSTEANTVHYSDYSPVFFIYAMMDFKLEGGVVYDICQVIL